MVIVNFGAIVKYVWNSVGSFDARVILRQQEITQRPTTSFKKKKHEANLALANRYGSELSTYTTSTAEKLHNRVRRQLVIIRVRRLYVRAGSVRTKHVFKSVCLCVFGVGSALYSGCSCAFGELWPNVRLPRCRSCACLRIISATRSRRIPLRPDSVFVHS